MIAAKHRCLVKQTAPTATDLVFIRLSVTLVVHLLLPCFPAETGGKHVIPRFLDACADPLDVQLMSNVKSREVALDGHLCCNKVRGHL